MEACNGCLIRCTHYNAYMAELISSSILINCPCSKCIIKMVCVHGCDDFKYYIRKTISELRDLERDLLSEAKYQDPDYNVKMYGGCVTKF